MNTGRGGRGGHEGGNHGDDVDSCDGDDNDDGGGGGDGADTINNGDPTQHSPMLTAHPATFQVGQRVEHFDRAGVLVRVQLRVEVHAQTRQCFQPLHPLSVLQEILVHPKTRHAYIHAFVRGGISDGEYDCSRAG